MISPKRRRILLGVTGGIAAYKSADLCRRLIERGCEVRVVMSAGAREFITPLTLQAVSGNPVHNSLLDESAEAGMGHIELARWADLVLIAPATAHFLAKIANGLADDLLSTLCLATTAPVWVAPAMNQQMWQAPALQANVSSLVTRGVRLVGPGVGDQACGDVGPGRMLEPVEIAAQVAAPSGDELGLASPRSGGLTGSTVLITAGPTREAIDPVRFITNHSTGKMGYAVAAAAQQAGARVQLVSGPCALDPPPGVELIRVESARDMYEAVMTRAAAADIYIGTAAVSDYRPVVISSQKIKKGEGGRSLELERTDDIIAAVGRLEARPFTVGFAAETNDVEAYAMDKLKRKSLDMIAANQVGAPGMGFAADHNALSVFWPGGGIELGRTEKWRIAEQLIGHVVERYRAKHPAQTA